MQTKTSAARPVYPLLSHESVADVMHGHAVSHPFLSLEGKQPDKSWNDGVATWVEAQQRLTQDFCDASPFVQPIRERMLELSNIGHITTPVRAGSYWFYLNRKPGDEFPTLTVREARDRILGTQRT